MPMLASLDDIKIFFCTSLAVAINTFLGDHPNLQLSGVEKIEAPP